MNKKCSKCKIDKEESEYYKNKSKKGGINTECKKCSNVVTTKWRKDNIDRSRKIKRKSSLKNNYGITVKEHDAMAEAQDGRCAICKEVPSSNGNNGKLHVDHDHETMEIRSLLCSKCNIALGLLGENIITVQRMMDYILKFEKQ